MFEGKGFNKKKRMVLSYLNHSCRAGICNFKRTLHHEVMDRQLMYFFFLYGL